MSAWRLCWYCTHAYWCTHSQSHSHTLGDVGVWWEVWWGGECACDVCKFRHEISGILIIEFPRIFRISENDTIILWNCKTKFSQTACRKWILRSSRIHMLNTVFKKVPFWYNNDTVSLLTTVSYMKGVRKPVKCSINEISRSVHILRSVRCKGCVCVWVNYCKFREILRKFL